MFPHFNHETELFPIIRDRVRSIQEKGLQRQEQREPTETQAVYETRQAVLHCGLGTLPSNINHCAEEEGKGCPPPELELLGITESSTRGPANRDSEESLNCVLDIRQLKVGSWAHSLLNPMGLPGRPHVSEQSGVWRERSLNNHASVMRGPSYPPVWLSPVPCELPFLFPWTPQQGWVSCPGRDRPPACSAPALSPSKFLGRGPEQKPN